MVFVADPITKSVIFKLEPFKLKLPYILIVLTLLVNAYVFIEPTLS